jgi:hypothetical protein
VDRIDQALKNLRDAEDLLTAELNERWRVLKEDNWQTARIEDTIDHIRTSIEDLYGLPERGN